MDISRRRGKADDLIELRGRLIRPFGSVSIQERRRYAVTLCVNRRERRLRRVCLGNRADVVYPSLFETLFEQDIPRRSQLETNVL